MVLKRYMYDENWSVNICKEEHCKGLMTTQERREKNIEITSFQRRQLRIVYSFRVFNSELKAAIKRKVIQIHPAMLSTIYAVSYRLRKRTPIRPYADTTSGLEFRSGSQTSGRLKSVLKLLDLKATHRFTSEVTPTFTNRIQHSQKHYFPRYPTYNLSLLRKCLVPESRF